MTPESFTTDLSDRLRRREGLMTKGNAICLIVGLVVGLIIGALAAGMLGARNEAVDLAYGLAVVRDVEQQLAQSEQRERDLQNRVKDLEQRVKDRP